MKEELIKCLICGKEFPDLGNHPLTCGSLPCVTKAGRRGWWDICKEAYAPLWERSRNLSNENKSKIGNMARISLNLRTKLGATQTS
jgi:hypothetical protein